MANKMASLRAKRSNLSSLAHAFRAEIASSAFGLLTITTIGPRDDKERRRATSEIRNPS
jgi:hypothetical protein